MTPHTAAKHQIIIGYLQAWLRILLNPSSDWEQATYAEGFAGAGIYKGGEPGSPINALRIFLGGRDLFEHDRRVNMMLIEEDSRRLEILETQLAETLAQHSPKPTRLSIDTYPGDCAKVLLPKLTEIGAQNGPVFAVLDSWGGPDVPLPLARAIAAIPGGEVLVTFGPQSLIRFGSLDEYRQAGDLAFGDTHWRRVLELPTQEKKPFLVTAYRDSLKSAGFKYVISFEMLTPDGRDLHLVFGTSHHRGLEKMKDAMWKINPTGGLTFRDPRDPNQQELDIELQLDLGSLERALLQEIANGPRTVEELWEYTLLETIYRPAHATKTLRNLRDRGVVTCSPNGIRRPTQVRLNLDAADSEKAGHPTLF